MRGSDSKNTTVVPLYAANLSVFVLAVLLSLGWGIFVLKMDGRLVEIDRKDLSQTVLPLLDIEMFENLEIEAKSVFVWDVTNKKAIFSRNGDDQLPLASLTKLMTTLVASEILPPYFSIENQSYIKDKWNLGDIISFTLVTSSNSAASAIALAVNNMIEEGLSEGNLCHSGENCDFIKLMNERASELGLSQTYFTNPTGLDNDSDSTGGYGSARDIARLMTYIQENMPDLLKPTTKSKYLTAMEDGKEIFVENTNFTVEAIPGILGSKTGLTDSAGGNLAIILDAGFDEPYALVVLGSSERGRFEDMDKLIKAVQEYLSVNSGVL